MPIRPILTAALTLSLAGAGLPAAAQMVTHNPTAVQSGSFGVEPLHTRILFAVNHFGFTTYYGDFTGASGTLTLAPKGVGPTAVNISVPVASVATTNATLDTELRAADWLDAAKFPTMTFVSTRVVPAGPGAARVTGDLTLHGVTRPVTLTVKFGGAGINVVDHKYTVGFDATGTIKRSAFGVTKFLPLVGDAVTLTISAAFEKQG